CLFASKLPCGAIISAPLYVRHVDGLNVPSFNGRWTEQDLRPAAIFDDVADLTIYCFRPSTAARRQEPGDRKLARAAHVFSIMDKPERAAELLKAAHGQ